ncbi:MAG TPA: NAD-dependent epimerase/dehydratase family protein [Spirochaetia bacterium]|nr:NAD-dependent epimerase/dehydratase family protein [Spirochaetia bacterium]
MKILFIGGTGNISLSCTESALEAGFTVTHLNRGTGRRPVDARVETLRGDIRNPARVAALLEKRTFDVVADFISFVPDHLEGNLKLFTGKTGQYIFISSASVYRKPVAYYVITESTPAHNPYWEYSQNKIACENLLFSAWRERALPATVIRPSHTYANGYLPFPYGSPDFTVADRILKGKEILLHGDGQSLWTLTHADDFARGFIGLCGHPAALGETFHITGDEVLSWRVIAETVGEALGREPRIVYLTSEEIAAHSPELGAGLLGDKAYSVIFDNSKLKRLVPGFRAIVPFHQGVRRCVDWFNQEPSRKVIDTELNMTLDRLCALARTERRPS